MLLKFKHYYRHLEVFQPYKSLLRFITLTLTENAALRHCNSYNHFNILEGMHSETTKRKSTEKTIKWEPERILEGSSIDHSVIVLNREISLPPDILQCIWQRAHIRCTVDGGTNHWLQFLKTECQGLEMKPPDLITGDFDSINKESLNYFKTTRIVHTPDQDYTDFTKALALIRPMLQPKLLNDIVVLHDTSGRFDQIMGNINTLHRFKDLKVHLLSRNSLTWLLRPGKHSIEIPSDLVNKQRWCALMPIGEAVKNITTTGLKWDLKNDSMEFGGLVSTSNTYASKNVQIETPTSLIWSMGVYNFDN
ncbi:thiamin pyrophosphokinase 1 isoform X1 [Teleopsis dalmanni]|uniref:thiamin pyrophosphokinase 1 isoform X1 n=2 Tax=Teleopsis dalmanni TaxID=139649 RepID=UPI0018CEE0B0|nr:thiamin pyrophosphokinase 1 isoform X1 [Teleopsis dalmanni]